MAELNEWEDPNYAEFLAKYCPPGTTEHFDYVQKNTSGKIVIPAGRVKARAKKSKTLVAPKPTQEKKREENASKPPQNATTKTDESADELL